MSWAVSKFSHGHVFNVMGIFLNIATGIPKKCPWQKRTLRLSIVSHLTTADKIPSVMYHLKYNIKVDQVEYPTSACYQKINVYSPVGDNGV